MTSVYIKGTAAPVEEAPLVWKFPSLPRRTPVPEPSPNNSKRYEVITIGAGPAGAFANLMLARLGIPASSRLHIDASPRPVKAGHADGLMPRTMEILKSLDIADEILNHAQWCYHGGFWKWEPEDSADEIRPLPYHYQPSKKAARWPIAGCTIHMGWVLETFERDLQKYNPGAGVEQESTLLNVKVNEEEDKEYPVVAELERHGKTRIVRAKYLIGADGAHSAVRKSLGIKMEGSSTDDLFGVIDVVLNTDFPGIRMPANIEHKNGGLLLIPREKNFQGHLLTRCYVPFGADVPSIDANPDGVEKSQSTAENIATLQARKAGVTPDAIFDRLGQLMKPFRAKLKEGTVIEWWAAYQVGRRLAERLAVNDSSGLPRIFLVGDGKLVFPDQLSNAKLHCSISHTLPERRTRHERLHNGRLRPLLETSTCHQRPRRRPDRTSE